MVEYMEYKTMFKSMYNSVKGWLNYHNVYYVSDKIGSYYYFNIYIDKTQFLYYSIYREVIAMNNIITQCPCCGEKLHISALQCSGCGVEIKNEFEPSKFDTLGKEQRAFLLSFLKNRGNMKTVQNELGISYPTAKKKLDDRLESLDIAKTKDDNAQGSLDMSNLIADSESVKASEIIKAKLIEHGGRIIVHTARGLPCEIIAHSDGKSFITKKGAYSSFFSFLS